jgi:hypothetical protein
MEFWCDAPHAESGQTPIDLRRRRSPFAVRRSPFSVQRSAFAVHRLPFSAVGEASRFAASEAQQTGTVHVRQTLNVER